MADHSSIEWTDATWNPITGCSVVSPGCTNCYAMRLAGTRLKHHPSRAGLTRETKAGPVWTGESRLNTEWLDQPLRWKRPRMIFVCAHADLFAENVPDEWIDKVFAVMALAPQHTFQVLTKRAARMRTYLSSLPARVESVARAAACIWPGEDSDEAYYPVEEAIRRPLPNVWLGVSAEDQQRADERVPELLATPAAIRFVSAEPLLGPIDFSFLRQPNMGGGEWWLDALKVGRGGWFSDEAATQPMDDKDARDGYAALDWIIVGGESGKDARPMHGDWARTIRNQCAAAGTAFFFKQWGAWAPNVGAVDGWALDDDPEISRFEHREWEDGRWSEPFYPMWCDWADGNYDPHHCVSRIGKRRAGRLLDGLLHDAMPGAGQ
ncbi:DUF5131 family protein [Aquamicrobium terrae]